MKAFSDGAIRRRARTRLLLAQNCAQATLLTLEDVGGARFPGLARAATNLEGGVVGCGSTCGVVTGGVLGIGAALSRGGAAEEEILGLSREYVQWFETRFGTTLCRERTGVDFGGAGGMLRYLLPGTKLLLCLQHTGEALVFLSSRVRRRSAGARSPETEAGPGGLPREPHCAGSVIRRLPGGGSEPLAGILAAASGFSGGVAGNGAACGALLGAFLWLGLEQGLDPRAMSLAGVTRTFIVGHVNLARHRRLGHRSPGQLPREPFARTRFLADRFLDRFGSLHCAEITGTRFASSTEIRDHLCAGDGCERVLSWCVRQAGELSLA